MTLNLFGELQEEPVLGQRVRFRIEDAHGYYPDAMGIGVCNPLEFQAAHSAEFVTVTVQAWESNPLMDYEGYTGFPLPRPGETLPFLTSELEVLP